LEARNWNYARGSILRVVQDNCFVFNADDNDHVQITLFVCLK